MKFIETMTAHARAVCLVLAAAAGTALWGASYADNTYQKLSDEYLALAEAADDAGEYAKAGDYAKKAKENADLSKDFIANMTAKDNSEAAMKKAETMLRRAKNSGMEDSNGDAYTAASSKIQEAKQAYDEGRYEDALRLANETVQLLSAAGVKESPPLPEYYIIDTWARVRDCLWNIAGRPYIYNDPTRWKKLYNENKRILPKPDNPDLVYPKIKIHIPKLGDEYREGVYDPNEEYETIGE